MAGTLRRLALVIGVMAAPACTASAATPPASTTTAPCRVVELPPPGRLAYGEDTWTADGTAFAYSIEEDEPRWTTIQCAHNNRP